MSRLVGGEAAMANGDGNAKVKVAGEEDTVRRSPYTA